MTAKSKISIIRSELKGISKTRLMKFRTDVRADMNNYFSDVWNRAFNCDDNCLDIECPVYKTCEFSTDSFGYDVHATLEVILEEIDAELKRR